MSLVPLLKLCRDEFRTGSAHNFGIEPCRHFFKKRLVAPNVTGLQDGGPDGHVRSGKPDALVNVAGRVPDLEPQVPEHVEDVFNDLLTPGGLLVRQDEQEVDV